MATLLSVALMIGATVVATMTVTFAPVNIEQAYAQEDTVALTMNKEITNPSGGGEESVINAQSAENSENAAATRESTSSLTIEGAAAGEDDTPANHREMILQLPNDRTLFRIVESADESSGAAAGAGGAGGNTIAGNGGNGGAGGE